ncbi:TetR/AcrR family transcriptional regulator [Panacagrimonas sp.]|uniref:TetR/AcrR family transcriptional regulator n=1 Tax=Panacagrimonas sp. TaxID=2480088 RepID=UPI003B5176C8
MQRPAKRAPVEQRLLQATERLLEQGHSFGSLTVEQLAAEAGMARATFYLHFRDKGELVLRLMGQLTEDIVRSAGLWFENAGHADRDDIERALVGIVGAFRNHRALVAAINDTAPYDPDVAALYRHMMDRLCAESRRAIAAVRRQGKAHPQASAEVADILTWAVDLYCARFIGNYDGAALNRLAKSLAHICASAIFLPAPPTPATAPHRNLKATTPPSRSRRGAAPKSPD